MWLTMKELDEKQCANLGQLLNCFGKGSLIRITLQIDSPIMVDSIGMLQEIDKAGQIFFCIEDKSGIPIVMKILKTPSANGQQRVMYLHFPYLGEPSSEHEEHELLYAIKKVLG